MAEWIPCKHCGGKPEYFFEWTETAFGDKRFVGVRCSQCASRTSAYMCGDRTVDQYLYEIIDRLWNDGRISRELKLCPFCGGTAKIVETDGEKYEVQCTSCGCRSAIVSWSKKTAIAYWNRMAEDGK